MHGNRRITSIRKADSRLDPNPARRHRRPLLLGILVCALAPAASRAHIDLAYPDGPVTMIAQTQVNVQWDVYIPHGPGTIKLELSTNVGSNYSLIVDGITYTDGADRFGNYSWTVPAVSSTECKIRVTYTANGGGVYYNGGGGPSENDPTFTILNRPPETLVLENGVGGYQGTRDTTIYQENTNTNGGGQHIFSGRTAGNQSTLARRALIAFNLSSIPPGSTVLEASLQLTVSKTQAGSQQHALRRLTADWGEGDRDAGAEEGRGVAPAQGDATWASNFHSISLWSTAGGDFLTTTSTNATVGAVESATVWMSAATKADVQAWVDNPAKNYGWILLGNEGAALTAKRFYSSEHPTAAPGQRPRLTISYEPPPSPAAVPRAAWMLYP